MIKKLSFFAIVGFATISVAAQTKRDMVDKIITAYNKNGHFNGLLLVAEDGRVIIEKVFGKAVYEWSINNTLDTKMEIASITKTFTAIMIMQLISQDKINLHGKIIDYIPEYSGEGANKITIDHLLRHSSGLQQDIADFPTNSNKFPDIVAKINEEFFSLEEQVEIISKRNLLFEPGSKYSYSSDGYAILGRVIEKVTGLSYENALQKFITGPLNLKNTGYKDHLAFIPKKGQGYVKSFSGISRGRQIGINPAGGIYSTIYDLFAWEQSLYTDKLIDQESKEIIFTKTPYLVGYGWQINNNFFNSVKDSVKMVRCTGSLPGFNSLVVRFPNHNKTIILMENLKQPSYRQFDIVYTIASVLFNKPYELPKPSFVDEMHEIIQRDGVDAALAFHQKNKSTNKYYTSEGELNRLGYFLLNDSLKVDDAIKIFQLNTELFPKSANVYDSLAEAYMVKGNKQKAIYYYNRSLEFDPRNDNAKQKLKQLQQN